MKNNYDDIKKILEEYGSNKLLSKVSASYKIDPKTEESVKKYIKAYVDVNILDKSIFNSTNLEEFNNNYDLLLANYKKRVDYEIDRINQDDLNKDLNGYIRAFEMDGLATYNYPEILSKLKTDIVINMNYGAPSTTYVPMASYRVVGLIDTLNDYSREVLSTTNPKDILVELEKFEVDAKGDIVPGHNYKLYIPLSKLIDIDIVRLAARNAKNFEKKLGGEATEENVSKLTSALQKIIASSLQLSKDGMKVHKERSVGLDDMDASLVYVSEEIMPNGELKRDAQDISASNTSLAIYGAIPRVNAMVKYNEPDEKLTEKEVELVYVEKANDNEKKLRFGDELDGTGIIVEPLPPKGLENSYEDSFGEEKMPKIR